ncbi:winged helix-turn-helix domain-containing protein [Microbulbifer bruguierae]|uniref:Winged helix-turn-helix domain-containing protein n=1 Tax=Microbulbifer bruguierae TaxID=3029061 RepID=A0ABY8N9S2_9GAMM|nr:winged helix-turn-helix domain-containing protein [Microbulbifer bruguierae]WGL15230.1 winged helix-turn-helix domain-containing protein [Microbulbifer bruguierae]
MIQRYNIGDYLYDPARGILSRDDTETKLEPQVNGLLQLLAEHAGDTLSRESITNHIWPERVVSDDALRAMIKKLRDAFDDSARDPDYIRTEPLKGYRLIAPVLPHHTSDAKHSKSFPRRLSTASPIIVGLGVCAIILAGLWITGDREQGSTRVELLTRMTGSEVSPDYSPAINRLVFSHRSNKDDFLQLYVKDLDTQQVQRLTWESANYANAHWSPDGQELVYSRSLGSKLEHYLARFDPDQGIVAEQPLLTDQPTRRYLLSWSQTERAVYLKDDPRPGIPAGISILNLGSGKLETITAPNVQGAGDIFARESPDGNMLAVLREVEAGKQELLILDKTTGSLLHTRILKLTANHLAWSEESSEVVMSNFFGAMQVFQLTANVLSVLNPLPDGINDVFHHCGPQCVYMRRHNGNFLDLQEQPNPFLKRPLMASRNLDLPGAEDFPLFSTDQRGLYFLANTGSELQLKYRSHRGSPVEIYKFSSDARVTALTLNSAGSHIAGVLNDRVFVMNLETPSLEFISSGAELVGFPNWSPDESGLQFSKHEKGTVKLYNYDLKSGKSTLIIPGYLADIRLSNERFLRIDADNRAWLMEKDHNPHFIAELPSASPNRWKVRDDWLYFTAHEGDMALMHRASLSNGKSERVALAKNRFRLNFDLSEHSERALFVKSLLAESNLVKVSLN